MRVLSRVMLRAILLVSSYLYSYWRREGTFVTPACLFTIKQCLIGNQSIHSLSPLSSTQRQTVICKPYILAVISMLLRKCSPAHIHRPAMSQTFITLPTGIMSIVVSAVNRILDRWPGSNICIERFKALLIARTHGNSSFTIMGILRHFRIETPILESMPYMKLGRLRLPMSARVIAHTLPSPTATALTITVTKGRRRDGLDCSTETFTDPKRPSFVVLMRKRHHCPTPVDSFSQIDEFHGEQPPDRLKRSRMVDARSASIGILVFGCATLDRVDEYSRII